MMKDFVLPIFVLSFICLAVAGALAAVNDITFPIITQAAAERAEAARSAIIPGTDFIPLDTSGLPATVREAYAAANNAGYVFMVTTIGYGGEMQVLCGINTDGAIITSVVLSHAETQGLGTIVFDRAVEYEGMDVGLAADVDAISGATITSNAYKRAVMDAFAAFEIVRTQ